MKFGSYLRRAIRTDPDWSDHYVNYETLKAKLKEYSKRRRALRRLIKGEVDLTEEDFVLVSKKSESSTGTASENDVCHYFHYEETEATTGRIDPEEASYRISTKERADFCNWLDAESAKAARLYATQLENLTKSVSDLNSSSKNSEDIREVGREILELYAFIVVNTISVRQILIRYDAFVRTFDGMPLSQLYLHSGRTTSNEYSKHVFDIGVLESLKLSYARTIDQRSGKDDILLTDYLGEFSSQFDAFSSLLSDTLDSVERSAGGNIVFRDRFIYNVRNYFLVGSNTNSLSLEPKMRMRGMNLKNEMATIVQWRENNEMPQDEKESKKDELDPENVLPLFLNLLSCFLHMVNNYIIEPSSAYYANALGSNDAFSGLMMGCAPWAALLSSVAYSFWTNYEYKTPTLFAAFLQCVGNVLYAVAYSYKSMPMCLTGRLIAGLGAPRIINRRYVADATPFSLRTAASAAFALATAVGAAMGPGLAIVLDYFDFEFYLPLLGKQYFNGMTGPGWFMAFCWGLFFIFALIFLKEPNRSGLEELKQREAAAELQKENEHAKEGQSVASLSKMHSSSSVGIEEGFIEEEQKKRSMCDCYKHLTRAVIICMSLIFMKRIALESIVGSTSLVTKNRYGWSIKNVGTLHLVNGTLVIPVSILSGWLSQFYQDRYLALWCLSITLAGMLILVDFSDFVSTDNETYNEGNVFAVGPGKYIAGSVIAFSGVEACESFVASLMSKVVPSELATGTFNSGLLATLMGTSGRATGDLLITVLGLISLRNILNLLMIPAVCLTTISIILVRRNYAKLDV